MWYPINVTNVSPEIAAKYRSYGTEARIPVSHEAWLMQETKVYDYVVPHGRMVQVLHYMNAGFRGVEAVCIGATSCGRDIQFTVNAGWLEPVTTA